ncbi:MAG TPA: hypothetical protein VN881_01160 [Candidatus Acidoferrales bacterium]|nr:hypothetical protein [Candidatus Acidoferrales bacterium]
MSTFSHHFRTAPFLLSAAIVCALSVSTFGGDGADKPTTPTAAIANVASGNGSSGDVVSGDASRSCANSARPSQTREKKVYTNDDVAALRKNYAASTVGNATPDNAPSSAAKPNSAPRTLVPQALTTPLSPDKDPAWYAQQAASASSQIANIDDQVQRLRNFSASNAAPGSETPNVNVGLNIYAPADGITTDAQIQLLLQQRADLDAQLADLQDRARANAIDPGVLRRAADNPESVQSGAPLTPAERLAATRDTLEDLQSDLAATRDTEAAMHQEAAAQNVKIIPETKFGGGFTADFLKQLNLHQAAVQEQLSTVEDTARKQGIPTGSLP